MIHLPPPYRLETIADVRAFLRPRPDENEQALLNFAKRSAQDIKKPPILGLLPSKFDIELREVKTSVRWIVKDIDLSNELQETINLIRSEQQYFLLAVQDVQDDYFQVFRRIIEEGRGIAGKKKPVSGSSEAGSAPQIIASGLQDQSDAYELLVAVLRRYLNTKQKNLFDFLKMNIARLCSFTPSDQSLDQRMIDRFRRLPPSSSLIVNDLKTLYVERLERLKRNMFLPHAHHFLCFTKGRLTRLPVSAHVKRNIIDVLNGVAEVKDIEKAKKKITHYLKMYEERIAPEEMLRLTNIFNNFYEKLYSFEGFFQKLCSSARIKDLHTLFCEKLRTRKIDVESLTAKTVFTLYPCKDIHDFLKGQYSGDCSGEADLATAHLLNPRFFNVRIFQDEKWIGCIYMLDFTDRGVLLLDRIQIGTQRAFILINFFPSFIKQFASFMNVRNDFNILAPSTISNFRIIQESFNLYAKGLSRMSFSPGAEDRRFESARQRKFYVIDGAVSPSMPCDKGHCELL